MSDWAMSPPCCKTLDLFGKRSLQIHCLGIYILPESWLWQKRSNLPNFRKNEFISLYNFLPWYALANVLLIVGGIKVFSFSIRELFESLKDMCVILFPRRSEVCFWSGWWLRWALPLLPSLSSYIAIVQLQLLPLPLLLISLQPLPLPMFANVCQVITLIWEFTLLSILFSYDTTFGFVLTFALLQVDFFFFSEQLSYLR